MSIPKLTITISPTADGLQNYIQILSPDTDVNVVLIAQVVDLDVRQGKQQYNVTLHLSGEKMPFDISDHNTMKESPRSSKRRKPGRQP